MKLYNYADVMIEYECSTVGIMIKMHQEYVGLSRLADEPIFKGLKSCMSENLLHNFKVLDKTLRAMNSTS